MMPVQVERGPLVKARAPSAARHGADEGDKGMRFDEALREKDESKEEAPAPAGGPPQSPIMVSSALHALLGHAFGRHDGSEAPRAQALEGGDAPSLEPDAAGALGALERAGPDAPSAVAQAQVKPSPAGKAKGDGLLEDAPRLRGGAREAPEAKRPVPIKAVELMNHFPVSGDPIRQIATAVSHALEADASAAAAPSEAATLAQPVKTLHVQLEPEALGTVTLHMRLSGNHMSVRVDVAEPATLDMISREQARLQKSMSSDICQVDSLTIRSAGVDQAAPSSSSESAGRGGQDGNQQGPASRGQQDAGAGQGRARDERHREPMAKRTGHDAKDTLAERARPLRGVYL